jgi:hypothetical protein
VGLHRKRNHAQAQTKPLALQIGAAGLGPHVHPDSKQDTVMTQTTAESQLTSHQSSKVAFQIVPQIGLAEAGTAAPMDSKQDTAMTQTTAAARQTNLMIISLAHQIQTEICRWI